MYFISIFGWMGSWWGVRTCFRTRCQGTVFFAGLAMKTTSELSKKYVSTDSECYACGRMSPTTAQLASGWWPLSTMMSHDEFFLFLFMTNGGWLSLSASNFGRTSACHGHNSILDQDIRYSNQKCQNHMPIGREHLQILRFSPCFPHDMSRFPVNFPTNPVSVRWTYSPLVE